MRTVLSPFVPYLALSLVHLVILSTGPGWAVTLTKALLMPVLALAVVLAMRAVRADRARSIAGTGPVADAGAPRFGATPWLLLAGIAFSWGGDVALSFPGDGWFVVGLGSFLAAHLVYLSMFVAMRRAGAGPTGMPRPAPRVPVWALVIYPVWYVGFLSLLGPHTGALLVPVAAYGLALGAMAALAAGNGPLVATGGALFVVSDSVLGLGRFLPGYDFAWHDAAVMVSYLAAQGFIALGVVVSLRVAARPSRGPGRPAVATAP